MSPHIRRDAGVPLSSTPQYAGGLPRVARHDSLRARRGEAVSAVRDGGADLKAVLKGLQELMAYASPGHRSTAAVPCATGSSTAGSGARTSWQPMTSRAPS